MKISRFITLLGLVTLIGVAMVMGLNIHPQIATAQIMSWMTLSIFFVFSGLVYFMAAYSAKQENKNTFTGVILVVMMSKMFLCVLVVALYVKTYQPSSNHFLIPFFSIYILYTIFEVYFMTRIGKYDKAK